MTPHDIHRIAFNAGLDMRKPEIGMDGLVILANAIAAAARAEAIEEAARLMNPYDEEGTLGALNAASIRAMLNTGEKT